MSTHTQLTLSPKGLVLAGNVLATRNDDGTLAIDGNEARIQALLIAAYGKPVSKRIMDRFKRAGSLLKGLNTNAWDDRTPHTPEFVRPLAKADMLIALTGLGDMDADNIPVLQDALKALHKGVSPESLLKAYLAKDDSDDNDDDSEEDDENDGDTSSGDNADSGGEGGSGGDHYNPDEPRIPAGQSGGGQWTSGGGVSTDSGSISTDAIRSAIEDGMNNTSRLPQGMEMAGDGEVFENREGRLPIQPMGYYTISVIPTPGVAGAGQQRIVTGQGGEAFYTSDHYKTFQQIK